MPGPHLRNAEIADVLERVASLLETQGASEFRIRAYRHAGEVIEDWPRSVDAVYERDGTAGLEALPGVGQSIAAVVRELLLTGKSSLLDRLEGQASPEDLFAILPGVGDGLARRIHHELGVETLEELEVAAHDGSLERVRGVGERRAKMIRTTLETVLRRSASRMGRRLRWFEHESHSLPPLRPPVGILLEVDDEYRRKESEGSLHRIAPKRFNLQRKSWLPIYHVEKREWSFTAMFSNTARAHRLHRTRDWVVIFWDRHGIDGQATVVSEHQGPLEGRRVVRGRDRECLEHYGIYVAETTP